MPNTARLIDMANQEIGYFIMRYKNKYSRPRPTQLEPRLKAWLEVPGHPAYPSGHATQSMVLALIMAEIDPKRAVSYVAKAKGIAYRREIAGFHYASDSAAGQDLARVFVPTFLAVPKVADLLIVAKSEVAELNLNNSLDLN
jgi:acid phosphatase (class A)